MTSSCRLGPQRWAECAPPETLGPRLLPEPHADPKEKTYAVSPPQTFLLGAPGQPQESQGTKPRSCFENQNEEEPSDPSDEGRERWDRCMSTRESSTPWQRSVANPTRAVDQTEIMFFRLVPFLDCTAQ